MKYLLLLIFTTVITAAGFAQDSIRYRVIFMGDNKKMDAEGQKVFQHAANNILESRTTVFFMDDNQYLQGKLSPGSKDEKAAKVILRSQYEPIKAKEANVYSIVANHQWNKMKAEAGKSDVDT